MIDQMENSSYFWEKKDLYVISYLCQFSREK